MPRVARFVAALPRLVRGSTRALRVTGCATALLAAAATLLAPGGCRPLRPPKPPPDAPPVHGVWGTLQRSTDREGDERVDRHELQLVRQGDRVVGFWNRLTTWTSGDGRPFSCGGDTRYELESRILVAGVPTGHGAKIGRVEVLPERRRRPPCAQLKTPTFKVCELHPRGSQLLARCDEETIALDRRMGEPIPLALALGQPGSVTGVWTWHHRSGDAQGDIKVEDEVWHLLQRGDRVEGHYDRRVVVRSGDGRRFVCNNELTYDNIARFDIEGRILGGRVHLKEVGFEARPGACETSKRTLDEYQGLLAPDGSMIHLSWDKGTQLLYRRY